MNMEYMKIFPHRYAVFVCTFCACAVLYNFFFLSSKPVKKLRIAHITGKVT